jgi:hypothetical protein
MFYAPRYSKPKLQVPSINFQTNDETTSGKTSNNIWNHPKQETGRFVFLELSFFHCL